MKEYLDAVPDLKKGDSILLLTDDETTIDEIHKYLWNDYNWVYLNRPRKRAVEYEFDGHIPSGDEAFEVLAIHTELHLAKMCTQVVYGKSGFVGSLAR